jgi:opacity protein-like surface antigen
LAFRALAAGGAADLKKDDGMSSTRLSLSLLAAAALLAAASSAHAADYAPPPPPPVYAPPPQPCCDNWYLRGFVGVGLNGNYNLEYLPAPANVGNGFTIEHNDIADTPFFGVGIGYDWNNWLRLEATAEYRSKAEVTAFGSYTFGGAVFGDSYHGYLKSWVFLANAFIDLGTWDCFTPFVGAGVGGAYNTMSDLTDIGIGTSGRGIGRNSSDWNLAWALYAGMSYEVSKNFKIDLTYRYLNYGSVTDTIDCIGGCNADSYKFKDLYSNDIMIGLRWTCCDIAPPPPRYVYTPPPYVPPPPPLQSRG